MADLATERDIATVPGGRMKVTDTTFGTGDAAVDAYVVEPGGGPPRAGVLFLHWLGEHRSDRTQLLSEARSFAALGVRSVLPSGRLPWGPDPVDAETDATNIELEQRRLAAALDGLAAGLPKGAPIALVGHDFGAMHGLLLAARHPKRFSAAVLIAATPRWGDWFLRFWKLQGDRFDYLRRLAPLDPVESARGLRATTLWQFSDRDYFIAPMSAVELVRAAPIEGEPLLEWYSTDHAMRSPRARASRRAFLVRELGLSAT